MDALSEILKALRLTGALFIDAELKVPWSFMTPPPQALADLLLPEADHVVPYHIVMAGGCVVRLPKGPPVELTAGDIVAFPQGDRHVLCGTRNLVPRTLSVDNIAKILARNKITPVRGGGRGAATRIVCGFFACDRWLAAPMLAGLPRVIHVSLDRGPRGEWLRSTVHLSVTEAAQRGPGAVTLLTRLSELLFVETIRRYLELVPEHRSGWLGGLRDVRIAKSLALLHGRPAFPWTVEELARKAGLSRSAFAARFNHYVGQPPMRYLTKWRLALAADRLHDATTSVGHVAARVGYDSEASFTRAFKREFGLPPASWRRREARRRRAAADT